MSTIDSLELKNKYLAAAKLLRIRKNWFSVTHGDNIQAYDLAIGALEKQVPRASKKVNEDYGYYVCPVCEFTIGYTDIKETHKYCLNCGQKLSWSK